jgi:hypothetical protein
LLVEHRHQLVQLRTRALIVERRRFRKPKVQSLAWHEIALAVRRNVWVFERIEVVTRNNESIAFSMRKYDGRLAAAVVETICRASGMTPVPYSVPSSSEPKLAPATK